MIAPPHASNADSAAPNQGSTIPALEFHNVTVAYDKNVVLMDIDFILPRGSCTGVLGPNGAGKSSLLKAALGLQRLSSGWIKFWGESFRQNRNRIAYVPQRESVAWDFPATVLDVVLMGTYHEVSWWQPLGTDRKQRALEALKTVRMDTRASRALHELSGGQQQRVFLARALVQRPQMLLLDEPLAGVDVETEEIIINTIHSLCAAGATTLVVHHDLSTVENYFDHVLMVNSRLICCGKTSEAFNTETRRATYGPRMALLEEVRHAASQGKRASTLPSSTEG